MGNLISGPNSYMNSTKHDGADQKRPERMHLKHIGSTVADWNTYVNKSVNFDRGKANVPEVLLRLPFEKSHSQRTMLTTINTQDIVANSANGCINGATSNQTTA